jgi:hypothetical protein
MLTAAAWLGLVLHAVIAALAARQAADQSKSAAIAAVRGFFCGTPEFLRIWAKVVVTDSPSE